jgi:4-hydroxybenzoate polyprenyltransferase
MTPQTTNIRAVALPAEHGGWALIIEPLALGLLVAPSFAGLFIGAGALAAFLARHPLKLAVGDRRKDRILKRTSLADRFVLLYVALATVFFTIAVASLPREFLLPFLIAGPLVFIQFLYDARGHSRDLIAELAGALAVGSISTAIALAGGWSRPTAFALWIIVACRHVPTILYLRVLLSRRRQKQRPTVNGAVIVVQLLPLLAVYVLLFFKIAPVVAMVVFAILFGRAVIGLFNQAEPIPKKVGISEIAFGTFTVLMVSAGYRFGW